MLCLWDWSFLDLDPFSGRLKIWGFINQVLSYGAPVCQLLYELLREPTEWRHDRILGSVRRALIRHILLQTGKAAHDLKRSVASAVLFSSTVTGLF
jgi:hypothetical protein